MSYRLTQIAIWLASDPRRARAILFVTLTAVALVPGGSALAGQASGGSG